MRGYYEAEIVKINREAAQKVEALQKAAELHERANELESFLGTGRTVGLSLGREITAGSKIHVRVGTDSEFYQYMVKAVLKEIDDLRDVANTIAKGIVGVEA